MSQGRSLKALALLSLGLTNDDGTPIFDLSVLPWSAAAPPSSLKLSAKELRCEVTRRCVAAENVLNAPRPGQWPVKKSTEWLIGNPIVAEEEVAFIKKTILDRVSVSEHAGLEGVPSLPSSKSGGGNWVGKYPYLRLIHAIIDDNDIKTAYLRRLHIPGGRMAVENRNTEAARTSNVWYMVAEKWNDELFSPTTSIKDSHSDYSWPIAIPWESVEKLQPATPEKVEEKWNSMNLALKRAISNWERSGQGDGGITGEDDLDDDDIDGEDGDDAKRFGSLEGRSQRALDLRHNFFDKWNTYLLYLWDVLDEHNLVQSTMQQLLEGVGAGNGSNGVPSVVGGRRQSDDNDSLSSSKKSKTANEDAAAFQQLSTSIESHSQSLVAAARIAAAEQAKNRTQSRASEIQGRINSLRDSKREMAIRLTTANIQQVAVDAIVAQMTSIDEEIQSQTVELNSILSTPTRSNRSPSTN